ncbi:MAG: DMT family transporter [Alphaproteobacteria bacterium]
MGAAEAAKIAPVGWRWLGLACGIVAAFCFSMGTLLSPTVYAAGGSAAAIVVVRLALILPVFFGFAVATKRPIVLPPRQRYVAFALGILTAFQTLVIFTSFRYIPISLAILIEYTYPLLVLIAMRVLFGEGLTVARIVAMVVALAGLALALGVDPSKAHPLGVALAALSAVWVATRLIASSRFLRTADVIRLLIHMQVAGLAVALPLFGLLGLLQFPQTLEGVAALGGMAAFNGVGVFLALKALTLIGPVRTSMAQAMESVFTVSLAGLLLGESLSPQKILGAAMVIGAVATVQFLRNRPVH